MTVGYITIYNGKGLEEATGGSLHSHLITAYSGLFSCFINSPLPFHQRRKDVFMETAEGISCEMQWAWIKTQEWKDVCGSALSCNSPPPHCPVPVLLPLICDFLAKPLLPLHLPFLARTDSVSNQQAKLGFWKVSLLKNTTWKHAKRCLSDKRIEKILFWPRGSIKGEQTWSRKVLPPPPPPPHSPAIWLTQPILCW